MADVCDFFCFRYIVYNFSKESDLAELIVSPTLERQRESWGLQTVSQGPEHPSSRGPGGTWGFKFSLVASELFVWAEPWYYATLEKEEPTNQKNPKWQWSLGSECKPPSSNEAIPSTVK